MLIFLGDSINLGVELVQETGELTPESFDHKTKIKKPSIKEGLIFIKLLVKLS
mgnify:CR=1 FL=1